MPRIRSIKPEFTQNDKLSALHAETNLLALGLICFADDEGYFPANPKLVQAAIFPLRELVVSVPEMLRSLQEIEYIERFPGTDGREYGRIVKFLEHQRVSHPTPSKVKELRKPPEPLVSEPEVLRPELKGNRSGSGIEGEVDPEQQPPLNLACKMIEVLSLTDSFTLKQTIAAAIEAEATYQGISHTDAARFIYEWCRDARPRGIAIDKFTFQDTKWRTDGKRQVSAAETRADRSRRNILDGFAANARRADAGDSSKRKDGTGE